METSHNKDLVSIVRNINLLIENFQHYNDEIESLKLRITNLESEIVKKNLIIDQLKDELNSYGEKKCQIEFYKSLILAFEAQFVEYCQEIKRLKKDDQGQDY